MHCIIALTQDSKSLYDPNCLHVCLTKHVPYEMTDVLGCLVPNSDKDITELLESLKSNLSVCDGSKYDVPEMLIRIRSGECED